MTALNELGVIGLGTSAAAVVLIVLVVAAAILSRSPSPFCRDCGRNVHKRHTMRGCPDPLCACRIRDSDEEVSHVE